MKCYENLKNLYSLSLSLSRSLDLKKSVFFKKYLFQKFKKSVRNRNFQISFNSSPTDLVLEF